MQGLDRILELQEVDSAIDRLMARRRVLEAEGEISAARAEADAAEDRVGELGLRLDELGRDQQRLDHEVDSLAQKGAAEDRRLYDGSIVNTKELESLQREILNLKKRRSDREDELLGLMEQRESLEADRVGAEAVAADLRTKVETLAGSAGEELVQIGTDLEVRTAQRDALRPLFDPELVELYDDLRAQKKGVGAAALVDGVCQGCHEKLAAMELDKLKKTDGVRRCQHCRRILILP